MSVTAVRVARSFIIGLLVAVSSLSTTGTATAGGPTSALLVSPSEQQATALYYSDPEYTRLQALLGESVVGKTSTTSHPAETVSDYVTITWLIHDVTIWRIDRVFLPTNDQPLIVTEQTLGSDGSAGAIQHRSPDPTALTSLLTKLGLIGSAGSAPADQSADVVPAAAAGADIAGMQAATETIASPSVLKTSGPGGAAWWLLGGLFVGIAACALTIRYVPAVRRRVIAANGEHGEYHDGEYHDGEYHDGDGHHGDGHHGAEPGDGPVRMVNLPV